MFILVGLTSSAQLGGWFKWNNEKYIPSAKDYAEVVKKINTGTVVAGKWYSFSCGEEYQILHPTEWVNLLLTCYQATDNTITRENLAVTISNDDEVKWGDDLLKTSNYYWSKNGDIRFVPEYSGLEQNVKVIIHNGRVTLKQICGNPQGNKKAIFETKKEVVEIPETPKTPYIVEEKDTRSNDTRIIIINNTPVVEQIVQPQVYCNDGYGYQQPRMGILGFAAAMIISNQNRGYSRPVQVNNNNYNNYNSNYNGGYSTPRGSSNYGSMSGGRGNTGNNNSNSNQGHMSGGRSGNGSSSGGSGNGSVGRGN